MASRSRLHVVLVVVMALRSFEEVPGFAENWNVFITR
jgi:hypothetical protein